VQGRKALRKFRGGKAPGEHAGFLLRESLPPPWECTSDERLSAEEAYCGQDVRLDSGGRKALFDALVAGVARGLPAPWHRVELDPDDPALSRPLGEDYQLVVFRDGTEGEPYELKTPQVEVALSLAELFPTGQMPPRYQLSVTVRSAAR
jgi:hypothetical protein